MSTEDQQDRKLPASERRIKQARDDGQVARSRDLASFLLLATGCTVAAFAGQRMLTSLVGVLQAGLAFDGSLAHDPVRLMAHFGALSSQGLLVSAVPLLSMFIAGIAACLAMGGWNWTFSPLLPKWSRLDPVAGIGKVLSRQGAADAAKVVGFVAVLGMVLALTLWGNRREAVELAGMPLTAAIGQSGRMTLAAVFVFIVVLLLIAAADVPLQLWKYFSGLRMSVDEVRREHRESDGNPQVKSKIRARQRAAAQRRMMEKVATADVIVTNPTHYAVALSYPINSCGAPRVVAKGTDLVALRIRKLAAENGVPTLEAPALTRALYRHTELDQEIPAVLYQAVAQVLAYVFQLRRARHGADAVPKAPGDIAVPAGLDPLEGAQ